ncbi:MAG TPA: hypothetical protein VGJ19_01365 [Streptosporangiaceae bacterium]
MAGELEEQRRLTRRELGAEAARLGENFGLGGPPQGAYRARRRSTQWGCGTSVLATALVLAFVIPELQHRLTPLWALVVGAVTVGGLLLMAFAPRAKWDRLFWYPGGVAQRLAAEPEPKILRWADAATVRIAYDTGDDSIILDRCIVDGPGAAAIEADRKYQAGLAAFAREAERVIELTVLPGLTDAYQHGQPVVFGELTVSRAGLGYQPRMGRNSWWLRWPEVRTVKAHGPGRGLYVHPKPRGRGKRWINLELVPNGILAHRLIEHAAAPYQIPVNLNRE